MIHDISHCSRHTCPLKDTCYRYLAYLEAVERDYQYITIIVWDNKTYKGKDCDAYWEVRKEGNDSR